MIEQLRQQPWLVALLAALLAVFAAMAAHRVGRAILRRVFHRSGIMASVLDAIDRPAAAVLPLAALQAVWQAAQDTLPSIGTLRHINGVLLIAALTWLAAAAIRGFARGLIASHPATMDDNLDARRIQTQANVLARSAMVVVVIGGTAMALMTFPGARQLGASLLASAGVLGIIGGLAARPVFSNLIAGLQLALAQPLRIDDVLIVKGEWGRVEEITGSYVVLRIWDERRLIVPLQWFIENPFENWTRSSAQLLGAVFIHVDYATPMEPLRAQVRRLVEAAPEWDGRVCTVQVTDATERTMQVRILVSAANSGRAFDLRCKVREGVLAFLAREYPDSLPRVRAEQPAPAQAG
jgi:small-conductance mechanosensitive channel